MEITVKHFSELTTKELYEILKLRSAIFVVEQNCPYLDMDDVDYDCYHVWLSENDKILAYCRIADKGQFLENVSIGRVITATHGMGHGAVIMERAVKEAIRIYNPDVIELKAQSYAEGFYNKFGFESAGEEFLEDGILHIHMYLYPKK